MPLLRLLPTKQSNRSRRLRLCFRFRRPAMTTMMLHHQPALSADRDVFVASHFPAADREQSPVVQHRRGYQACDPCRKRKVKCDLGSQFAPLPSNCPADSCSLFPPPGVDNPRPPPCVRCRRESKRCEFSATRRKRKASDADTEPVLRRDERMMSADGATASDSDTILADPLPPPLVPGLASPFDDHPRDPKRARLSGSVASTAWSDSMPTSTPRVHPRISIPSSASGVGSFRSPHGYGENGRITISSPHALQPGHMMNRTAAELLSPAFSNTHDALHLLSEAAGRTEDLNRQHLEQKYAATRQSSTSTFTSASSPAGPTSAPAPRQRSDSGASQPAPSSAPVGWYQPHVPSSIEQPEQMASPLKGPEDIAYSKALRVWSRLRFIRASWFSPGEAMDYVSYYYHHMAPLSPVVIPDFRDPSTHHTLLVEEPVLAVTILTIASRHKHLSGNGANARRDAIHGMLWSYLRGMIERLFWGQERSGSRAGGSCTTGRLRSLGTVEALLLLTDWHPRALYFPPGDDENSLLDSETNPDFAHEDPLTFQEWLEPVWRSDRMSWMLISMAQALSFELGVFDDRSDHCQVPGSYTDELRKRRVRRLILVYVSQCSGRLGIPSMLPLSAWQFGSPEELVDSEANAADLMQDCWVDISKVMYDSNCKMFSSKEQTTNLIKSNRYRERIDEFMPHLHTINRKIEALDCLAPQMRCTLRLEYEYTRMWPLPHPKGKTLPGAN